MASALARATIREANKWMREDPQFAREVNNIYNPNYELCRGCCDYVRKEDIGRTVVDPELGIETEHYCKACVKVRA